MRKYSCYGCKYSPAKRVYPCTTCGTYVLAEDGEGTVFIYNKWTPKDIKL